MDEIYRETAIEAALKGGQFIKKSLGKIKEIAYKGRINMVTDVDKKAEDMIIKRIGFVFPSHGILSEESKPKKGASEYKWIIDPLDGTTNFIHSFPFFSVSIALEKNGKIVLGVVYDPMREELFFAEEKKGASLNGQKISVSRIKKLSEGFLATGFAYGIRETADDNIGNFRKFMMNALAIRRAGSAALDLCYVACGRFDGFWELDLYPWDCAAGGLIIKEAGGKVTKFDGLKHSHYDKEILVSNKFIHKQMVQLLGGVK